MTKEQIARVCHEVNRAYCQSIGDHSQPKWDDSPAWQRDSAILGVDLHISNPDAGPQASHESWMAQKVAEGWLYGDTKDPGAKRHPCIVPFDELPVEQQAKDFIFRSVVHALAQNIGQKTAYHELLARKDALEQQISDALHAESVEAIDTVRRLIADYALTAKDCGFSEFEEPKATVTAIKAPRVLGPAAIKYRGPNGEAWSGRGRTPGWLDAIVRDGGNRDDFLIAKEAA